MRLSFSTFSVLPTLYFAECALDITDRTFPRAKNQMYVDAAVMRLNGTAFYDDEYARYDMINVILSFEG